VYALCDLAFEPGWEENWTPAEVGLNEQTLISEATIRIKEKLAERDKLAVHVAAFEETDIDLLNTLGIIQIDIRVLLKALKWMRDDSFQRGGYFKLDRTLKMYPEIRELFDVYQELVEKYEPK
jgi:hypothetical protein